MTVAQSCGLALSMASATMGLAGHEAAAISARSGGGTRSGDQRVGRDKLVSAGVGGWYEVRLDGDIRSALRARTGVLSRLMRPHVSSLRWHARFCYERRVHEVRLLLFLALCACHGLPAQVASGGEPPTIAAAVHAFE